MPTIATAADSSTTPSPLTRRPAASLPVRAMFAPLKPVTVTVIPASERSVCARAARIVSWDSIAPMIFAASPP